jgi:hypothetical protein
MRFFNRFFATLNFSEVCPTKNNDALFATFNKKFYILQCVLIEIF